MVFDSLAFGVACSTVEQSTFNVDLIPKMFDLEMMPFLLHVSINFVELSFHFSQGISLFQL